MDISLHLRICGSQKDFVYGLCMSSLEGLFSGGNQIPEYSLKNYLYLINTIAKLVVVYHVSYQLPVVTRCN